MPIGKELEIPLPQIIPLLRGRSNADRQELLQQLVGLHLDQ